MDSSGPRSALAAGVALACFLPACRWDFQQLSVVDFRKNLCEVLDNFNHNAQGNCAQITDPGQRAACFQQLNQSLAVLAGQKLAAVNAYMNCNEQQLKAAQSIAEKTIEALIKVAGNLVNPLSGIDLKAPGTKSGNDEALVTIVVAPGASVVLQAGPKPVAVMLSGSYTLDLLPAGAGYAGPVTALGWTATVAPLPPYSVTLIPGPQNVYSLGAVSGGARTGELVATVLIDGPGVSWATFVKLPLRVSADLVSWSLSTGAGIVPAAPFFPLAPKANYRLGPGCPGTGGLVPDINLASVTRIGDPLTLRLDEAKPVSASIMMIGDSSTSFGGIPLPLDLTTAGAPGCALRVAPAIFLPVPTNAAGSVAVTVPVPASAALVGAPVFAQWFVVDPVNALGGVLSDGMRFTLFGR